MLKISNNAAQVFHGEGLRSLRHSILAGWSKRFRTAGELVGKEGRNRILGQIDAISVEDPTLTVADLTMLADLMLVNTANEMRRL